MLRFLSFFKKNWQWFLLAVVIYSLWGISPVDSDASFKEFSVQRGAGLGEITADLKKSGLIKSEIFFKLLAVTSGSAHLLRQGDYQLSPASSTWVTFRRLLAGPPLIPVLIVEGASLRDVDTLLSRSGVIATGSIIHLDPKQLQEEYDILKNSLGLEGYLFPDTYYFYPNSSPLTVARKLLDNFQKKAWPVLQKNSDFRQKIILASLIEKEIPSSNDRKIVAGILLKRLQAGMALQIDATLSYIKCQAAFLTCSKAKVRREDVNLESLYNTYIHNGLPPGPISNPGLDAILAVLNPKTSQFWYYLSDPVTKKTVFSRTLEEHNENRAIYLKI